MTRTGTGELILKVLIAAIWIPLQIALSLLFATGGLFLLLVAGIALSPLIGLFFLIRWGIRRGADEPSGPGADPIR